MEEIWRDCVGFDNYEVSNLGRVRTKRTGCVRKPVKLRNGTLYLQLWNGSCYSFCLVRDLVAEAFIGEMKEGYMVWHKDGDKNNNRVDNLEYVSRVGRRYNLKESKDIDGERWRDVEEFNNLYEVSDLGRVRYKESKRLVKSRIYERDFGVRYTVVHLYDPNSKIRYTSRHVARLVAKVFIEDFDDKLLVIPKDKDYTNCRLDNLLVIDSSTYRSSKDLIPDPVRMGNTMGKKVKCVETGVVYNSMRQCAFDLNVSPSNVRNCAMGRTKKIANGLHVEFV